MKPSAKTLRPYQARLVTDVCRADGDVLVEQPTGSGKTMQIVTLVAMRLGRRFTHAVISAPQEQIEHGFVHRDYHRVDWSPHDGVAVPSVAVPEEIILAARKSDLGSVRQIRSYLKLPGPLEHALACTHAALNRLEATDLPADLTGRALFIDEAHHASADGLSQIVSIWRERGGQLFFFTATPYRGDGRAVLLDGMRSFRRSLAEHMAEGFAPGHLDSEIVALGKPGDAITPGQFSGEEAPPREYYDDLVNAIARKWLDDGKPKTIVRVPPMRGGSGGLVARLIQALASHGARVLDATGTAAADKERFLHALKAEQGRSHAESRYDVMVGIQRVFEGTDWPVCSAAYCVGMPGSLNTVVQLLGRAMRPKGADYPEAHRDQARLVFFVPCGGGSALADLSLDHSRHALLTCCFLADHEVGQEWIVLREVRRGIEAALGPPDRNPAAADAENEADEPLAPLIRAEAVMAITNAREQLGADGREPALGSVVELAAKSRPDLPEPALHRVAAEVIASQPGRTGAAVREAIHQEVARQLRIDPQIKQAMEAAFGLVLTEFRSATLKDSAVLESVRRQIHGVTGGQMREFAQRLRDAAPRPLTEEMILGWADEHRERTGQWPTVNSEAVVAASDETWRGVDSALRRGLRALPGGSSLAQLLAERRGFRNVQNLPNLTEEQILGWADVYRDRSGQWPNQSSGAIEGTDRETWAGVNYALHQGARGLPGGSSLARLLAINRAKRNPKGLPQLSVNQILEWADEHHERLGEWPSRESGAIPAAPGETWRRVDNAFRYGRRGILESTTLAEFLAEHRGFRNPKTLPELTEQQILAWADEQFQRTGEWPKVRAEPIHAAPGETWSAVNASLVTGARGLPGGSSLAKLLAEHRGVRNPHGLPAFTEKQILLWADEYFRKTGQWPKMNSGEIPDCRGETWMTIQTALQGGLRGLPGGSSLPKLLAKHRDARNQMELPRLTIEQILAWADAAFQRTGDWPKQSSGLIVESPGDTWAGVNFAMKAGSRGLPGGCSLAQLLADRRGVRNTAELPPLSIEQILLWADAHYERTGKWPNGKSGPIPDAPGETWGGVQNALFSGLRGFPGGSTLAQLLQTMRGVRNIQDLPPLSEEKILSWAESHLRQMGKWPKKDSGPILDAPGETWNGVQIALLRGRRGLEGGSSLVRLLEMHGKMKNDE